MTSPSVTSRPPHRAGAVVRWLPPILVAAAAAAAVAVAGAGDPTRPGSLYPPCPVKLVTGLACPGCGVTRMLHELAHGDVVAAAGYNALALVLLPYLLYRYLTWARDRITGRPARRRPAVPWAATTLLAAVVTWGVVRNLPFAPFTSLYV